MSPLTAIDRGNNIKPIGPGVYIAVCYGLIDLGTHENPVFGGDQHKVLIQWELPEVRGEFERDGKAVNLPRAISRRYTLSLSDKSHLRKDLESWRGRKFTDDELDGFDLRAVLGTPCQLQIVHETGKDGRVFANVAAIMALPKDTSQPSRPENPIAYFSFEETGDKPELPELPDWVRDIITESKEWRKSMKSNATSTQPSASSPDTDDEDNIKF